MIAVLSDIHANYEALTAVMHDIGNRPITELVCLGDTVGYGPNPSECVDIVRDFSTCLCGTWDLYVCGDSRVQSWPSNPPLQFWSNWTRSQLSEEQLDFLKTRPPVYSTGLETYAHGDPSDYLEGYLFPERIHDAEYMNPVFDAFDNLFFCGKTHMPGICYRHQFLEAHAMDERRIRATTPSVVTVGSVGQPRDGDARACYVVYGDDTLEFVRVPYDVQTTRRKLAGIDPPGF